MPELLIGLPWMKWASPTHFYVIPVTISISYTRIDEKSRNVRKPRFYEILQYVLGEKKTFLMDLNAKLVENLFDIST